MLNLNNIKFSIYEFSLKVTETIIFPPGFIGIHLRNSLGNALKNSISSERFTEIWNKKISEEEQIKLRIGKDSPRGYIIEPQLTNQRRFDEDDILKFKLVLVGWLDNYINDFIHGVAKLGSTFWLGREKGLGCGKFKINNIENLTPTLQLNEDMPNGKIPQLILNFATPTRIEKEKTNEPLLLKNENKLEFVLLYFNLIRRIELLQLLFCNGEDFKFTKEKEEIAKEVKVHSSNTIFIPLDDNRNNKPKKLGGFIGEVIYKGDLSTFVNEIRIGEYLHIGGGCVYGLGKYEILN